MRAMNTHEIRDPLEAWGTGGDDRLVLHFRDNTAISCLPGALLDIAEREHTQFDGDVYVTIVFKRTTTGIPFILTAYPDPNYRPPGPAPP